MAKQILKKEIECLAANKNKNGTNAQFANNVQKTPQGQITSREAVTVIMPDQSLAEKLTAGKKYTVTITEE